MWYHDELLAGGSVTPAINYYTFIVLPLPCGRGKGKGSCPEGEFGTCVF